MERLPVEVAIKGQVEGFKGLRLKWRGSWRGNEPVRAQPCPQEWRSLEPRLRGDDTEESGGEHMAENNFVYPRDVQSVRVRLGAGWR